MSILVQNEYATFTKKSVIVSQAVCDLPSLSDHGHKINDDDSVVDEYMQRGPPFIFSISDMQLVRAHKIVTIISVCVCVN